MISTNFIHSKLLLSFIFVLRHLWFRHNTKFMQVYLILSVIQSRFYVANPCDYHFQVCLQDNISFKFKHTLQSHTVHGPEHVIWSRQKWHLLMINSLSNLQRVAVNRVAASRTGAPVSIKTSQRTIWIVDDGWYTQWQAWNSFSFAINGLKPKEVNQSCRCYWNRA